MNACSIGRSYDRCVLWLVKKVCAEEPRFRYPNQTWTVVTNNKYNRGIGQSEVHREPLVHGLRNKTVAVDYTREVLLLQIERLRATS